LGFIGTFLPFPEFYGPKDAQRKWTTQGFSCDLTGKLKFAGNRTATTYVFVTDDGTNRAFSCQLAPSTARGTRSVYTYSAIQPASGRLSHFKNAFGAATYTYGSTTTFMEYACTFGTVRNAILNNARYVVSGMVFRPTVTDSWGNDVVWGGNSSVGTDTNTAATDTAGATFGDPTVLWRKVPKFAVVEYTMTPWANITDAVSGLAYRVVMVPDGGRTAKIAVEWPDIGNIVTISLT
jgi:hypothetical protein